MIDLIIPWLAVVVLCANAVAELVEVREILKRADHGPLVETERHRLGCKLIVMFFLAFMIGLVIGNRCLR